MTEEKNTYQDKMDEKRVMQVRKISKELPGACGDFLRSIALTTSTLTRLAYAIDLKTFFCFLHSERIAFASKPVELLSDNDLEMLTQSDLVAYTEYLGYYYKEPNGLNSGGERALINHELSIKRKLCSIRSFYGYLFTNSRISSNVTELVPLPKIHEKPIIRLDENEVERILEGARTGEMLSKGQRRFQRATAERDYALLMLFLGTGIRVSECVGLNKNDIDIKERACLVTRKGGNQMVLYFPDEVASALEKYYEIREKTEACEGHEDALFLSLQRKRISQRAVENLVKKYAAAAAPLKPKISPHKLRSTYATNLYQNTGDIYLVADVLGHSSVDTTRKHYADMTDARRRMAAEHVHLTDRKK